MKIKFKKSIFFLLCFLIIFSYLFISKLITNTEHNFYFKLKSIVPNSIKHTLKNTIFILPTLKKELKIIKKENEKLKIKIKEIEEINQNKKNIKNEIFFEIKKNKVLKTKFFTYDYQQYNTSFLNNGKADDARASGYIEELDDKIIIVSADGLFLYFYKEDLLKKKFQVNLINSNIKEIINYPEFYFKSKFGIKDVYIDKKKLYISYSNQLSKDCFNTSILVSDINLKQLKFKKFFNPAECIKKNNKFGSFNAHISGGKITNFKNNQLLFSTGAFQYSSHSQTKENIFGKIIAINKDTSEPKIISLGHRNIQGLGYDFAKDIIFSTEHGPMGGDEFNLNFNPQKESPKNYGWPISSYGEHYGGKTKENEWKYKKAPLKKSHSKYGFIEPIKYFNPSIGISELIKVPKEFHKTFDNDFFISSMGNKREEGDLSIHHIKLDNDSKKILKEDIIVIDERIRDMKFIRDLNKLIIFVENSPGIGVISFTKDD